METPTSSFGRKKLTRWQKINFLKKVGVTRRLLNYLPRPWPLGIAACGGALLGWRLDLYRRGFATRNVARHNLPAVG